MFRFRFCLSDNLGGAFAVTIVLKHRYKDELSRYKVSFEFGNICRPEIFCGAAWTMKLRPRRRGRYKLFAAGDKIFSTAWRSAMRIFGDELRCGAKGRRFFPIFGSWLRGRTVAVVEFAAANGGHTSCLSLPGESD